MINTPSKELFENEIFLCFYLFASQSQILAFSSIVIGVTRSFPFNFAANPLTVYIVISLKISTFAVGSLHGAKNKIIHSL